MSLLERLRATLAPPRYADAEQTRLAGTVHRIGLAIAAIVPVATTAIAIAHPEARSRLLVPIGFVATSLVSVLLARRGWAKPSARLFVWGTWAVVASGILANQWARPSTTGAFIFAIAAAALLLRPNAAYGFAALSTLVGLAYAFLNSGSPTLAGFGLQTPFSSALVDAAALFSTAAMLAIAARHSEEARAQAQQSEARFRALAENAPDAISEFDGQGRFLYSNRRRPEAARVPPAERRERERMGAYVHPEDRPRVVAAFRGLVEGRTDGNVVYRALDPEGKVTLVESIGAIYTGADGERRVVTLSRDVTKQRAIEDALRASVERYRLLAEHAPDMIVEYTADLRFAYANPCTLNTLGYSYDEFLAIPPSEYVHPDDRVTTGRVFSDIERDGVSRRLRFRLAHKDGHYVWVEASGARYINAAGLPHVISVARDLTDELSLQEQLRQSQKMEAIGRLAGGVAHDFNNLLTVIGGYAGELQSKLHDGEAARASREILDATERAAALTQQLLLLSRRQLAQPGVVDLNAAIASLEPILRRTLPARIALEIALGAELPAVEINASHVEQVLLNLTLNARDAMPEHGTLRIETGVEQDGQIVCLRVSDAGHGMDETTRARAFEPFFSTKPMGAGTGLGLSTSYGIVKQAGGSISLESEPGGGTRVAIELPASRVQPSAVPVSSVPALSEAGAKVSILLVEDDVSVRRLLSITLESAGHRVTSAGDAAEALALAGAEKRRFDLLISDYMLPGQTGTDLSRQLRARWPEIGVVLMTGYAEVAGSEASDLPDGAELLCKPFTREQLQLAIARCVEQT